MGSVSASEAVRWYRAVNSQRAKYVSSRKSGRVGIERLLPGRRPRRGQIVHDARQTRSETSSSRPCTSALR